MNAPRTSKDYILFNLVRHVAYSDGFVRHTDAFLDAVDSLGMRYVFGPDGGLYQGDKRIEDPYNLE